MSQFYARYIPPPSKPNGKVPEPTSDEHDKTKGKPDSSSGAQDLPESAKSKRKRGDNVEEPQKHKKRRSSDESRQGGLRNEGNPSLGASQIEGSSVLDKYSVSKAARSTNADVEVRKPKKKQALEGQAPPTTASREAEPSKAKRRDRKHNSQLETVDELGDLSDAAPELQDENVKHATILTKFAKSRENASRVGNDATQGHSWVLRGAANGEDGDLHGLEPLPQPEEVDITFEKPSYSTLPPWLASPTIVDPTSEAPFESLGLSSESVAILRNNGIEKAFSIQTTVIPLLCGGARRHRGDVCISAATGSGKTLTYVLPLVESLKKYVTTKLRGLIVVPTRELVKQVRATCDMCASGTNLKIATALGTKSMTDEQDALVQLEDVYDPIAYSQERQRPIDWSTFSIDKVFDRILAEDELDCLDRVKKYSSKVDILICTPGRLVDHLRTTTGFSLDDVTWVIVDEADRLLNESYQEWIEVVMPALGSRKSTEARDRVLKQMRLDLPPRMITKVALSATMTEDISKLNSLGLGNPKMVVLGDRAAIAQQHSTNSLDDNDEPILNVDGHFKLPATLMESAISVGDGAEKPLFLLELLRSRIRARSLHKSDNVVLTAPSSDTQSSSSSLNSDSSSDADSDISSSSETSTTFRGSPLAQKGKDLLTPLPGATSRALIFTRSAESATRLSRLLSLLDPSLINTMTTLTRSTTSSASSRKALHSFRQGKTSILIATDRASRGLDVPDLEHVISYDIPASVPTYVHRVGRTARAGKAGSAWTLLAHREGRWFWKEIGKSSEIRRNGKVARVVISVESEELKGRYEDALKKLGEEVKGTK